MHIPSAVNECRTWKTDQIMQIRIQARVHNEEECVTSGACVSYGMVSVCLNLE